MASAAVSAQAPRVSCSLTLDPNFAGKKEKNIQTGIPFLDHMMDQLNSHAQIYTQLTNTFKVTPNQPARPNQHYTHTIPALKGDREEVDLQIVTVVGICLGKATAQLLQGAGKKPTGGCFFCPLDEALARVEIDFCVDDTTLRYNQLPFGHYPRGGRSVVGNLKLSLLQNFWSGVSDGLHSAGLNTHLTVEKLRGDNAHHIVESSFKAFARAIRQSIDRTLQWDELLMATPPRTAATSRKTNETSIDVTINLDGRCHESCAIETGLTTLDMMVEAVVSSGLVDLNVRCQGDTWIDDHHTTEDVGIAIGQCINEALRTKAGCVRMASRGVEEYGLPVLRVVMDLSNRPHFEHNLDFGDIEMVGDVSCEMVVHFLESLSTASRMTVHVVQDNSNGAPTQPLELVRRVCSLWGECLNVCSSIDPRRAGSVTSSKGTLSA